MRSRVAVLVAVCIMTCGGGCDDPPASPEPPKSVPWYAGGTLHKATVSEWNAATARNRLATSADFVAAVAKDKRLDDSELLMRSIALEKCISTGGGGYDTAGLQKMVDATRVSDLAAFCYVMMWPSTEKPAGAEPAKPEVMKSARDIVCRMWAATPGKEQSTESMKRQLMKRHGIPETQADAALNRAAEEVLAPGSKLCPELR